MDGVFADDDDDSDGEYYSSEYDESCVEWEVPRARGEWQPPPVSRTPARVRLIAPRNDCTVVSKVGGSPDMLPGLDWPSRPSVYNIFPAECRLAFLMGASNARAPRLAESCAPSMRSLPQDVLQRIFQFADTHPLEFLAQLNLADVSSPHLPARGLLSFFYDTVDMPWGDHPEDATGTRVLFTPAERMHALQPRPTPESRHNWPNKQCTPMWTYPWEARALRGPRLNMDGVRLLGRPMLLQGDRLETTADDMCSGSLLRSSRSNAKERWVQLFQMSTDGVRMGGFLHFMIPRTDLANGEFKNAVSVFVTD